VIFSKGIVFAMRNPDRKPADDPGVVSLN